MIFCEPCFPTLAANYQITILNCKYNNLGMLLVRSEIARLQMRESQEMRRVWSSLVTFVS